MEIIRCYTCNRMIGSKYQSFKEEVQKLQEENNKQSECDNDILKNKRYFENISYLKIFEKLKIDKDCCRRHFMTNLSSVYHGNVMYEMYHDVHPQKWQ